MNLSEYTIDLRGDANTAHGDSRDLRKVSIGEAVGVPGSLLLGSIGAGLSRPGSIYKLLYQKELERADGNAPRS